MKYVAVEIDLHIGLTKYYVKYTTLLYNRSIQRVITEHAWKMCVLTV